jgi:hypothetical protein
MKSSQELNTRIGAQRFVWGNIAFLQLFSRDLTNLKVNYGQSKFVIGTTSEKTLLPDLMSGKKPGWNVGFDDNKSTMLIVGKEKLKLNPNNLASVIKLVIEKKWPDHSSQLQMNKCITRNCTFFGVIFFDSAEK